VDEAEGGKAAEEGKLAVELLGEPDVVVAPVFRLTAAP